MSQGCTINSISYSWCMLVKRKLYEREIKLNLKSLFNSIMR